MPRSRTREMARDKIGRGKTHRPRPAVSVVSFEIEGALIFDKLAPCVDHEAMDTKRIGCPGVEDDAVSLSALLLAQPRAAFDPFLRQSLLRQRPTEKPLDPLMLIDDKAEMSAIDLSDKHLRPFAERKLGEGWLFPQVFDSQAQGNRRVVGFPCA